MLDTHNKTVEVKNGKAINADEFDGGRENWKTIRGASLKHGDARERLTTAQHPTDELP